MIHYSDLNLNNIKQLESLWLENSHYHNEKTEFFKKSSDKAIFQKRVESWHRASDLKITIVREEQTIAGYCISSRTDKMGYIESLYIRSNYRRQGIGKKLIAGHIKWFNKLNCKSVEVETVYGNDDAIEFYKSVGIFPKSILMRLI